MFTKEDIAQFEKKGIDKQSVEKQIAYFKKGFPYADLVCAATPDNGLVVLKEEYIKAYALNYDEMSASLELVKMVPASGAASRMFSLLFKFLEEYSVNDYERFRANAEFKAVFSLIDNIGKFAFFDDLKLAMENNGYNLELSIKNRDYYNLIDNILNEKGLNYGNLPKGLIRFHKYNGENRTAFEEHLAEGALYCKNEKAEVRVHFTISPEHVTKFMQLIDEVVGPFEEKFAVKYDITWSIQKPSTDTIAVGPDNLPFRNSDGEILFRPAGHGALIENLNDIDADIVFVKNIDNIVPDRLKDATVLYKKVIGGMLLEYREQAFQYLEMLDDGNVDDDELKQIVSFCENKLMCSFNKDFEGYDNFEKIDFLFNFLNRPMRICGMVKNEGEPGGGPFWVKGKDGKISLQIVESSQINFQNESQNKIFSHATHFNPVDLVCSIKDFKGRKFDLKEFVDHTTGFISNKTKDGKQLKALELPGLWNGAMADWITVFVDVPLITFNPVKTVNDLLREEHQ
jgi:hypothetical protein